jgi:magnesium-transporting ATPase (P-type)
VSCHFTTDPTARAGARTVATGGATEMGRIGRMLATVEAGTTPLLQKMSVFSQRLTLVILVAIPLLGASSLPPGYAPPTIPSEGPLGSLREFVQGTVDPFLEICTGSSSGLRSTDCV